MGRSVPFRCFWSIHQIVFLLFKRLIVQVIFINHAWYAIRESLASKPTGSIMLTILAYKFSPLHTVSNWTTNIQPF